jgi:hypothetical protein
MTESPESIEARMQKNERDAEPCDRCGHERRSHVQVPGEPTRCITAGPVV